MTNHSDDAPRLRSEVVDSKAARAEKDPGAFARLARMTANELAVERTELAIDRTLMGADRSLMAWIRTALSMISFGFTIYKVLQGFEQAGMEVARAGSPRDVGLFLIGMGTVAMVMGTVEYWHRVRSLRSLMSTGSGNPRSSWPS